MLRIRSFSFSASALALALGLSACGGGGGGGGGSGFGLLPSGGGTPTMPPAADTSVAVSGTVATGAPASGSDVALRCANGVSGTATTAADGTWSTKLDAPVFPCLATASGGSLAAGQKLHSMLRAAGYTNITPLTELILARAAGMAPGGLEQAEVAALAALAVKLDAAQADIVGLLSESGYGAFASNPFTGEFKAVAGDAYDDLLEHLAQSLADGDTTLDGIVAALIAAAEDDGFDLPLTRTFKPAELAAQPQLNKAHLASAAGVLSMKLDAGANAVGAYVGGGAGNKAVLQLPGLAGTKVSDLKRIELELKGDAGGIGQGLPYAYLNFTVDLHCDATPLAANATLADVRARRRILVFDTYYHFMQAANEISTSAFSAIAITPATPGWRISGGTPRGHGGGQPRVQRQRDAGRLRLRGLPRRLHRRRHHGRRRHAAQRLGRPDLRASGGTAGLGARDVRRGVHRADPGAGRQRHHHRVGVDLQAPEGGGEAQADLPLRVGEVQGVGTSGSVVAADPFAAQAGALGHEPQARVAGFLARHRVADGLCRSVRAGGCGGVRFRQPPRPQAAPGRRVVLFLREPQVHHRDPQQRQADLRVAQRRVHARGDQRDQRGRQRVAARDVGPLPRLPHGRDHDDQQAQQGRQPALRADPQEVVVRHVGVGEQRRAALVPLLGPAADAPAGERALGDHAAGVAVHVVADPPSCP
jgi:hypothetical protein